MSVLSIALICACSCGCDQLDAFSALNFIMDAALNQAATGALSGSAPTSPSMTGTPTETASAVRGRLWSGLENRAIASGYVFAVDGDGDVLGYSKTHSPVGPDQGLFQILNLPSSGRITLIGFHPCIREALASQELSLSGAYRDVGMFSTHQYMRESGDLDFIFNIPIAGFEEEDRGVAESLLRYIGVSPDCGMNNAETDSDTTTETVNDTEITRGLPQFVLTWTGAADIDLHVVDPTGNHIYWDNPAEHGEYLDSGVGDDPGGGPENVFYDPDTAPHGDYQVWVDYYAYDSKPNTGVSYRVRVRYSYDGPLQNWLSGTFTTKGEQSETRTFRFQ